MYSDTVLLAFVHRAISLFTLLFPGEIDSNGAYAIRTIVIVLTSAVSVISSRGAILRAVRHQKTLELRFGGDDLAEKGRKRVLRSYGRLTWKKKSARGKCYIIPWRRDNLINEGYLNRVDAPHLFSDSSLTRSDSFKEQSASFVRPKCDKC